MHLLAYGMLSLKIELCHDYLKLSNQVKHVTLVNSIKQLLRISFNLVADLARPRNVLKTAHYLTLIKNLIELSIQSQKNAQKKVLRD